MSPTATLSLLNSGAAEVIISMPDSRQPFSLPEHLHHDQYRRRAANHVSDSWGLG